MRKTFVIFVALLSALIVGAAESKSAWLTDLPKAQEQAKKEHKLVLLDFTGSDWCPPCMALKKTVFDSSTFLKYAKSHLVLVEVDDPADQNKITDEQRKTNDTLAKQFNLEGRPTIIILNVKGKEVFREIGYDHSSAEEYIKKLQSKVSGK